MRGRRGLWIALIVFIALFAWIRFVELPRHRAEGDAPKGPAFLAVPAVRIKAFTVAFVGDTTRVERVGPAWWVVSPVRYPADPVAVQAFLSRCENLPVTRPFAYDEALASRYGLDNPSCLATLEQTDGRVTRLIMGGPAPATPAFYVRVEGVPLVALLGEQDADNYFRRTTDEWRQRRLLEFNPAAAVAVELSLAATGVRVRVERDSPRTPWRVVTPFPGLASASYLADYLKGLAATAALSFPSESPGAPGSYGLDRPRGSVAVTEAGGRRVALSMGMAIADAPGSPQIYAMLSDRPQLFGVPAGYLDLATKSDLAFRDRRLLRRAVGQYHSLHFSAGGEALTLVPDSSGSWIDSRESGRPHPVDRREMVRDWVIAQADSVVPADARGWITGEPLLRLEVTALDSGVERLEVSPARPGADGAEAWPTRVIGGEPERRGEVFLLPGSLIRPVLALLAR